MAKIARYTSQRGISPGTTGGLQKPDTQISGALNGIASELNVAARTLDKDTKQQERDDEASFRREEARALADDNARLADVSQKFSLEIHEKAREWSADMPDGGFGYTERVRDFANQRAKEYVEKEFPHRKDDARVVGRFNNAIIGVVSGAGITEQNTRQEWRSKVAGEEMDNITALAAAVPEAYGGLVTRWADYVDTSVAAGQNAKEQLYKEGVRRISRAVLDSTAQRNKDVVLQAFRGVFSDTAKPTARPDIQAVVDAGTNVGIGPRVLGGIYGIESEFQPDRDSPRYSKNHPLVKSGQKRAGDPMSSALGGFQVLAQRDTLNELGIRKEDRTNMDIVAPALARYVKRKTDWMESKGIEPTPGKQYMFWNMGPGAAAAVLRADPNEKIERVLYRVWAHKGVSFYQQALTNNPQMYAPGMTVAQVVANYDGKMARSMARFDKHITGTMTTSDGQVREAMKKFLPEGVADNLTARDGLEAMTAAKNAKQTETKEVARYNEGGLILSGQKKGLAFDPEVQKAVETRLAPIAQQVGMGLAQGDPAVYARARADIANARFIPDTYKYGLQEVLSGGTDEAKRLAYTHLSEIKRNDPVAYNANKLPGDMTKDVDQWEAYTEVLKLTPATALARIKQLKSEDGKQTATAMKDTLYGSKGKKGELDKITFDSIANKMDGSWFSDPRAVNDKIKGLATIGLKEAYEFHRLTGKTPDESEALAMVEVSKAYGVSTVNGGQTVMPYPPEKFYGKVDGSADWIRKQARSYVANYLVDEGKLEYFADPARPQPEDQMERKGYSFMIIPDGKTAEEVRSGGSPTYLVMYRRPDGFTMVAPDRFVPMRPDAEIEAEFKKENTARVGDQRDRTTLPEDNKFRRQFKGRDSE